MTAAGLFALFERLGIAHRTLQHPAAFRVGEGDRIRAALPGAHTKNLFLKDARRRLWLVSAIQDAVIDLKALPRTIGSSRLSFGSAAQMGETLGVTPGSVTAFALVNDRDRQVRFVLDAALARADLVCFHPLVNTATTQISQSDFRRLLHALGVEPLVVAFG